MDETIKDLLEQVQNISHLAVPKAYYAKELLVEWFSQTALQETDESCLITCTHQVAAPATEAEISLVESALGVRLPDQLISLLRVTNGAELFQRHYPDTILGDYDIARYKIFSCAELLTVHQELLDTFLPYAEDDRDFPNMDRLDYIAFCDILNGNYLALPLVGSDQGTVFYLDHEYAYYPYYVQQAYDGQEYVQVAVSIDEWLTEIIKSEGWRGMGSKSRDL